MCVNPAPDFSPPPPRCFFPSLYLGNIPTMLMSQASIFSVLAPMLTKSFFVLFCQSPVSRDGEHDFMIKVALDKCNRRREHIAAEGLLLFSSFFPSWLLQPFFFAFSIFSIFCILKVFCRKFDCSVSSVCIHSPSAEIGNNCESILNVGGFVLTRLLGVFEVLFHLLFFRGGLWCVLISKQ